MELAVALLALVVAGGALWLAMGAREQVARMAQGALPASARPAGPERAASPPPAPPAPSPATTVVHTDDSWRAAVEDLRRELERTQQELSELKAAAQVVPVPPLPRARRGGLDDLREQLRASHREPDEGEAQP